MSTFGIQQERESSFLFDILLKVKTEMLCMDINFMFARDNILCVEDINGSNLLSRMYTYKAEETLLFPLPFQDLSQAIKRPKILVI